METPVAAPASTSASTTTRESRLTELKEYVEALMTSQCHKLIVEAYSHVGGIPLARALLQCGTDNDPDP